jgi:hypothetical protein
VLPSPNPVNGLGCIFPLLKFPPQPQPELFCGAGIGIGSGSFWQQQLELLPTNIHSNTIHSQVIKNSSYIKNFLILIYEEF